MVAGLLASVGAASAAAQVVEVGGAAVCATCRIVIEDRLVLGAADDPEIGGAMVRAALGNGGRVHVISDLLPSPGIRTYDAGGRYSGLVGRPGAGPGEFRHAWRIATGAGGELYVHDTSGLVQVFGPDGGFRRTLRGPVLPSADPVIVGDSLLVIVSAGIRPTEVSDRDVFVYRADTGRLVGGTGPHVPADGRRASLAVFASGRERIWILHRPGGEHGLERWTLSGTRQLRMTFTPGWHSAVPGAARASGATVGRVWEDTSHGLLWMKSQVDDPSYRSPFPEPRPGEPFPRYWFDAGEMNRRHDSIISVIDISRGVVLAHLYLDEHVYQFLEDGRLVTMRESEDGYQWVELIRLGLAGHTDAR